MPLVVRRLRAEAAGVILPADDPAFGEHLARRRAEGVRCNVNVLGEAIVGNEEARRRLAQVLDRLERPDVDYVSVKISAICAGVDALGFDATVARVCDALRAALCGRRFVRPSEVRQPRHGGVPRPRPDHRRVSKTCSTSLSSSDLDAGIVLQAYLPDAHGVARSLGEWASRRRARGGGRIKVRVVKGANLAMENVEAEMHGWQPAPYDSKPEVDANYKAVLDVLLDPAFDDSVRDRPRQPQPLRCRVGARSARGAARRPDDPHASRSRCSRAWLRRRLRPCDGSPATCSSTRLSSSADDFPSAIAYLVRRLDENTVDRRTSCAHLFDLAADPAAFDDQAERFAASVAGSPQRGPPLVAARRRRAVPTAATPLSGPFANVADTDWTRPDNRRLDRPASSPRRGLTSPSPASLRRSATSTRRSRLASDACTRWASRHRERASRDPQPSRRRLRSTSRRDSSPRWSPTRARSIAEGDPEVSEAVDLARYYARSALGLDGITGARPHPLGPVVVVATVELPASPSRPAVSSPRSRLATSVILKPAPQRSPTAAAHRRAVLGTPASPAMSCSSCPADDDDAGRRLITHPDIAAVVLTGSYDTAQMFLGWRPDLRLHAETSGKNASSSPRRPTSTAPSWTSCGLRSATPARSARRRAWPSSRRRSTTTRAFLATLSDDAAASLRVGPAADVATESARSSIRPAKLLAAR